MRRAQTAVPAVLLTVMALIIWYVLWIYPEQRYELLFGDQGTTETPATVDYYYSTIIGEIGQSSGELLDTQVVSNLSVSYPETKTVISKFESQIMSANFLASEHKTVDLSNADADKLNLLVKTTSITGNPKLKVAMNNTLIYDAELIPSSTTSMDITTSMINNYGSILRITCGFNGWQIWAVQQCGFETIEVSKYVYAPVHLSDSDVFYLQPFSENAELMNILFTPGEANNFPVQLLINGVEVYEGLLKQAEPVTLSVDGDDINLGIDNNITLIAGEGAEYELSNILMRFYSLPSGMAAKYVVFDLPESALSDDTVNFEFELSGIVELGDVIFEILNTGAKYTVPSEELVIGNNVLGVYTDDLEETGNNVKIYSTTGRLIINEFKVK